MCSDTERCPVKSYKEYLMRRPVECRQPDSRFYLQPIKSPKTSIWFSIQPLGKNTIGNIARNMAKQAKLPSTRVTNHSGRKTAIKTLLHSNVAPTDVIQITGHKNVQSLNAYSHLSMDQQHAISNMLSSHAAGPSTSTRTNKFDQSNPSLQKTFNIHDFDTDIAVPSTSSKVQHSTRSSQQLNNSASIYQQPMTSPFAFHNCTINGNVTFNVTPSPAEVPRKKRRISMSEDSSEQ
jgi:hypothetical protein